MQYLKLSFDISVDLFPTIDALFSRQGALSITTQDAEDRPILEPKPGETPLWPHLHVSALFPANKNRTKLQRQLEFHLDPIALATAKWEDIDSEGWIDAWKQHYEPVQLDKALWVGSTEHTPPPGMEAILFLDPGLAFGTGSHPTTYLCLKQLAQLDLKGKEVIDYGCGSGILALAALKRGAARVFAVDIDPQALAASLDHAKRNQIDLSRLVLGQPEVLEQPTPILVANILANPLIKLADVLIALLAPGGKLILSGLLAHQAEEVKAAYMPDIHWLHTETKEEWAVLVGTLKQ
jgi:ribosomal protein L11 methyltransferase